MLTLLTLPAFRNAYLWRGLVVWGGLRLVLFAGLIRDPNLATEAILLVLVAVTVTLDAWHQKEDLVLGNLGIPLVATGLCALPLPLLAELLLP
jgi:hypothetical protein